MSVTAANVYIYLNRNSYTYVKQSTFNEIYPNYSGLTANAFKVLSDSTLEIVVNQTGNRETKWKIKEDDQNIIYYTGINPQINVPTGLHKYKIFNAAQDSFYLQAENYSTADYRKLNLTKSGGLSVFNSDLLQDSTLTSLDKWKDNEMKVSAEEKHLIAGILKDSIRATAAENTIEKIKKIGCYLGYKLFPSRGGPTDSLSALSVFNQYKCALKGEKIWCGNYSMIFNLFAHEAGIKTRNVEISKNRGGIAGNLHVFNEYFIPEQKKWACIDLTSNNIFFLGKNGNLLNAVEVKNADPADSSIKVMQPLTDSSLKTIAFNKLEPVFFETWDRDNDLKFYLSLNYNESNDFLKKAYRYFQKKYYYEFYSDNTLTENKKFYIK